MHHETDNIERTLELLFYRINIEYDSYIILGFMVPLCEAVSSLFLEEIGWLESVRPDFIAKQSV